jgi:hypothetical protein
LKPAERKEILKWLKKLKFPDRYAANIKQATIQLWNSNATKRGYMRMVDGQASDLYTSDTDTWSATSMIWGSGKEPYWTVTPPLDPVLARSHPSRVESC